jgi:manganese efflux pump family protein
MIPDDEAGGGPQQPATRRHRAQLSMSPRARWLVAVAVLGAILPAAMLIAACGASAPAVRRATTQSCFEYGVHALQRHETVTRLPRACTGLSRAQVNAAVGRALRDVVGPLAKAQFRRRALAESRYLAGLIRSVPAARQRTQRAAPAPAPSGLPATLAALASWIVTAAAGLYLLAGWLTRTRSGRLRIRPAGPPPAVIGCHAGLGLAGLGIWIAYMATAELALGWIAVGTTFLLAGLGMATLLTAVPDAQRSGPLTANTTATAAAARAATEANPATARTAAASTTTASTATTATASPRPSGARPPVLVIALHGVLATITILLVLLAVIGAG